MTTTIDLSDDIIDIRTIIERVEKLENTADENGGCIDDVEYRALYDILDGLKGYGGDEEWRGDWYPLTLIRDSYFRDYARELAEDCGMVNPDARWPNDCIDWDLAARELQHDYSSVTIDGVTYWYR